MVTKQSEDNEKQCQMSTSRECPQEISVEKLKMQVYNLIQQVEKLEKDMDEVTKFVSKGSVIFDNLKDSILVLRSLSEKSQEDIHLALQNSTKSVQDQIKVLGETVNVRLTALEVEGKSTNIKSNVAAALSGALLSVVALWKFLFDK